MSKYEDLEAFVRTIEAGSFTAAAQHMGVAKSAVSRRIQDLESRLGTQLIVRTTRKLNLTEQGRTLFERAKILLSDWDEIEANVTDTHAALQGPIKLAAPLSFGVNRLGPALISFMEQHPGIQLDIDFSDRRVDLIAEGKDLAIRIGKLSDSTLIARKLAVIRTIVAASPEYIKKHGMPKTPGELAEHPELRYSYRPHSRWQYSSSDGTSGDIELKPKMIASNGEFLKNAVIAGLGVIIEPTFILYDDLKSGRLIPILTELNWNELGAYAVYPPTRHLSKRVRVLVEYLAEHCGGSNPYWDNWKNEKDQH